MGTPVGAPNGPAEPVAGVVTTSILPSPVVQFILHAKIRTADHNDVVFVGNHAIQLKEVKEEGHLDDIGTKRDFDARIRAAKTFSVAPSENDGPSFIKHEDDAESANRIQLPPQLLVLTLDSRDIVFIYVRTDTNGRRHFVHQTFPMPTFDRMLFQPGEHLAVDPYSRAIAVAANEREVVIYAAKSAKRLQHELRTGDPDWCPVSAQRPIQVDGIIQKMDFLIPPVEDGDHVILLLVVVQDKKTRAIWIDWHYASNVHHAQVHEAQPLDQPASSPALLIPLRDAAFLLTNGHQVHYFRDMLSGSIRSQTISVAQQDLLYPGDSPMAPIWTNWCRPERGSTLVDKLYLAREDGNVFYLEMPNPSSMMKTSNAGDMACRVGSAFASVGDLSGPDVLVAAGDMSSGCVKAIGTNFAPSGIPEMSRSDYMEARLVEGIPNWASVTDMIASTLPGKSLRTRDSVFATSGRQPFGSIAELRHGLEARLSFYFPMADLRIVQDVWALPVAGTGSLLMILSCPGNTAFLELSLEDGDISLVAAEPSSLDADHETLLAAAMPDGTLVQVTNKTICVAMGTNASFEDNARIELPMGDSILAAACSSDRGLLVTAQRRGEASHGSVLVAYRTMAGEDREQSHQILEELSTTDMTSEPLAIACLSQASGTFTVVTTANGKLEVFSLDRNDNLSSSAIRTLPSSADGASICDSLAIIHSCSSDASSPVASHLMLCGLRDGRVVAFSTTFDEEVRFSREETVEFGQTNVKLSQPAEDGSMAYAMSGLDTCLLSWQGDDLIIESIWLSDKARPELGQGATSACTNTPPANLLSAPTFAESTLFVSGDELLLAGLERNPAAVPRQIPVSGTPNRLLYLEQQRCLACASLKYGVRTFSSAPYERRQIWPVIDFVPSRSSEPSFTHPLQPGERVYSLLEWSYSQDGDKLYSFLLVGGSYISAKSQQIRGRITFLQPTNRSWEVIDVKVGQQMRFENAVYALALWDSLTFVACTGNDVFVCQFTVHDRKWENICAPFNMHSAGTSISVCGRNEAERLISISTNSDSSIILQLVPDSDPDRAYDIKLVERCMAPKGDSSLHHLTLPGVDDGHATITLLTTKDRKLVGLEHPSQIGRNTSSRLLFEARLPRSLTRIKRANIRPRWKAARPPGIIGDDIVACSADGTLMGIILLSAPLLRRLSWLQRLCEWSEELSPHSFQTPAYSVSEETFARNERGLPVGLSEAAATREDEIVIRTELRREKDGAVDGDVIGRVLEKGGRACLERLVREAAERADVVGEWMRAHLEEELGAVEEVVGIVEAIVHGWL